MKNYIILYKVSKAYHSIIIKAKEAGKARAYFEHLKPYAKFISITEKEDISAEEEKGIRVITLEVSEVK